MGSLSSLALSVLIVAMVALAGVIIASIRNLAKYSGFREHVNDARKLAWKLKGEITREGDDLVITGNYQGHPATIRFSRGEETPGLSIRMDAPCTFTLWMAGKHTRLPFGRAQIRTEHSSFDTRFQLRSDDPTQARMFLGGNLTLGMVQKLCCSGQTYVAFAPGHVEISEMNIPLYLSRHVIDHLDSIHQVSQALRLMPGAEAHAIRRSRRNYRVVARAAIALCALATVVFVVAANRPTITAIEAGPPPLPQGVEPRDAARMTNLAGWRLAAAEDFDANLLAWAGGAALGRISADFSGQRDLEDAAYVLIGSKGERRLVMLAGGATVYDSRFQELALAARLSRSRMASVRWKSTVPATIPGDGLLVVRRAGDPGSAVVFFLHEGRLTSAVPEDYQSLSVR